MLKNIIKKTLLFSAVCLLAGCGSRSGVKEIHTFQQAQAEFQNADKQTVVVFDVDGVLTSTPPSASQFFLYNPAELTEADAAFAKEARATLKMYIENKKIEKGRYFFTDLLNATLLKTKKNVTESAIIAIIRQLQSRGIKVIALTSLPAGAFGTVASGRKLRFEKLQKLGIDFSSSIKQDPIVFKNLKPYNGDYPMFYKGILFANWKNDKGSVLGDFFSQVNWKPSKVLFFDDHKSHVKEVEKTMHELGISYSGYWYRGCEKLSLPPFNLEISKLQLKYLLEHDKFLFSDEAAAMLQQATTKKK